MQLISEHSSTPNKKDSALSIAAATPGSLLQLPLNNSTLCGKEHSVEDTEAKQKWLIR